MSTEHRMIPGTHEWPRTPECICGKDWEVCARTLAKEANQ